MAKSGVFLKIILIREFSSREEKKNYAPDFKNPGV
jgi:hypothetical protein